MASLKERLEEVMRAKGWQYSDLVAHSGESYSVVSQWLGRTSKEIKSIGKMVAAERLEAASGFAALWIAKGLGPKLVAAGGTQAPNASGPPSLPEALTVVLEALAAIPPLRLPAVQATLAQVVGHPEMRDDVVQELQALLQPPAAASSTKRQSAA